MKITDVRSTTVAIPLQQPLRYAQGVHPGRLVRTLVEVDTDEGITGLGEIGGSGASSDALIAALRARKALGRPVSRGRRHGGAAGCLPQPPAAPRPQLQLVGGRVDPVRPAAGRDRPRVL